MKKLTPFLLVALAACNQHSDQPADGNDAAVVRTKTMEYAVELGSVFHQDLNDEDFTDVSTISQQLIADVLSGKTTAYERSSDAPMQAEQVKALLQFTDTIWFEEPETGDIRIQIVERDYTKDFYGFTFREQWNYNAAGSVVERKVLGIAPRIPVFSAQGGELRGFTSAFWVKYE